MKRRWNAVVITVLTLLLAFTSSIPTFADGEFETKHYQVEVEVHEDQSYHVTETIDVNFPQEKHGIYRYIPYSGILHTVVDGVETREDYLAKIKDIQVKNDNYDVSNEGSNMVIKIGDKDEVITGKHTYDISYLYAMKNDQDNGQDVFYLNVIPTGWESSIEQVSVMIHMPKPFSESDIDVFAGEYGSNDEGLVEYSLSGNDISITSLAEFSKGTGITVRVMLPEEYFTGVPSTKGFVYIASVLALLCCAGLIFIWIRYGRERKYVKTVEFYPPDGLSPAEIGYIVDGSVDREDMLSLIIYFASKGYLKIEKNENGETYLIREKKSIAKMPQFQKTFFNGLFRNAQKSNKLEKVAISAISKGFYKQYEIAATELEIKFSGEDSIYEKGTNSIEIIADCILIVLIVGGSILFSLASGDISNMFLFIFPAVAYSIAYYLCGRLMSRRYIDSTAKKLVKRIILITVVFIAISIELAMIGLCVTVAKPPFMLYAIASALGFFTVCHSERRSKYGAEILGKSLGFRNFIVKAEKDRINRLVEENPQYFYDILPYAYAMKVTNKWTKQFEGIKINPPAWYYGNEMHSYTELEFQAIFLNDIDNISHSVNKQIDMDAPVSSGDSDDGGSSGGGAGGGGGGAW